MAVNDFIMPECTYKKYKLWKEKQSGKLYMLSTFIDELCSEDIRLDVLSMSYFNLKLDFFNIKNKYIKKTDNDTFFHKRTFQFWNKKTNLIFGFCDLSEYIKNIDPCRKDFVFRMICTFLQRGGIVRIGYSDYVFGEEADLEKVVLGKTKNN